MSDLTRRSPAGEGPGSDKITAGWRGINLHSTTDSAIAPPITCVIACSPASCSCNATPAEQAVTEHAATMLLRPPEMLTLDTVWTWGHRLRRGVEARIITHRQANEAWRQVVTKMGGTDGVDPSR